MVMYDLAVDIANYLSKYQKKEGLIDPLDKKVIMNSYGTEFYALLCVLVFKKTKNKVWKKRAISAIESCLEIRKNRMKIQGLYRWEFKNYALMRIYSLFSEELSKNLDIRLKDAILKWNHVHSFQTNWAAMRAINFMLKYQEFGDPVDLFKAKSNMALVLERQTIEGFFPDTIKEFSSQYHAYVLSLLFQYYELTADETVKQAFMKGVDFIIKFTNSEGDFNWFGRGKEQIFGYAGMIFALYGAAKISRDAYYQKIAEKMFNFVSRRVNQKNNFPIVLTGDEKTKEGWHSYNHKSDYLPFFAYYMLLSDELKEEKMPQTKEPILLKEIKDEPYWKISVFKTAFYHIQKFIYYAERYFFSPDEFWMVFKYRKSRD